MPQDDDRFEPETGRSRRDSAGRVGARGGKGRDLKGRVLEQVARRGGNPRGGGTRTAGGSPRSGRFNARGRGAKLAASFPKTSGWSFDRGSGLRVRPRRVTVKARVVKLSSGKVLGVGAHLRYLERDGTARDGEPGRFYSTFAEDADAKAFLERGGEDRHQFRLIVSPEDGPAFEDLKGFTRDLMAKMEEDLGTTLDWVAVDHFDTGHPHSHILIRGVTEDGKTLNIAGDYIAHGIRHRGSQIMTRALGPQSEIEVRQQLQQEVDAERLTRLDRTLLAQARDSTVDLAKLDPAQAHDPHYQQMLVGRARVLECMELAEKTGPMTWRLDPEAKQVLEDMGRRGDIIRTLHRDMARSPWHNLRFRMPELNEPEHLVIHGLPQRRGIKQTPEELTRPVVGKVLSRGTSDEDHERRYLVVDGADGHSHYVDIGLNPEATPQGALVRLEPKLASVRESDRTVVRVAEANGGRYTIDNHLAYDRMATDDFARTHERRLEAIRRATGKIEREPNGTWRIAPEHLETVLAYEQRRIDAEPVKVEVLSPRPIEQMVHVPAETWLDRELTSGSETYTASVGYGGEVRKALQLRQRWLIEQQLAEQRGSDVLYARNMLRLLRQREVRAVGGRLEDELGKRFAEAREGERIEGTYKRSLALTSGHFAVIEKSREFTLVPWRPELEKQLGRNVSGLMRSTGSISWTLGRERGGPSIGGM